MKKFFKKMSVSVEKSTFRPFAPLPSPFRQNPLFGGRLRKNQAVRKIPPDLSQTSDKITKEYY